MFQRGQKVVVIESSAKGGIHPKVGDIGYLDNMYLLPTKRLILLDIIFFAYKNDIEKCKNRVEKKRLVIDLGMRRDLRYRITKAGVSRAFYHSPDTIGLTSVGYRLPAKVGTYIYTDYPCPSSLYGIWTREVNKKGKYLFENLVTIPCGNIALFSSQSNRKYPMEDCSTNELSAWIQTVNPSMDAMWVMFFKAEANRQIEDIWRHVRDLLRYKHHGSKIAYSISEKFSDLSTDGKISFIAHIRQLALLNGMLVSCLDEAFFNWLDKLEDNLKDQVAVEWSHYGIVSTDRMSNDRNNSKAVHRPFSPSFQRVRSIFFRNIIMSSHVHKHLKIIHRHFPTFFPNSSNKLVEIEAERFLEIQKAADSNSSALNRIFDSKLVF